MGGVRRIRANPLSVTGSIASAKNGERSPHESGLEGAYAIRLEFGESVASFVAQPLKLRFIGIDGRHHPGVPDFLVTYRDGHRELIDVKPRAKLFRKWPRYKPRFKAALALARSNGWKYWLKTEPEIYTPYMDNATFLLPFRRFEPVIEDDAAILACLASLGSTTPALLLEKLSGSFERRGEMLNCVWRLVAGFQIRLDLSNPLNMDTLIWLDMPGANAV